MKPLVLFFLSITVATIAGDGDADLQIVPFCGGTNVGATWAEANIKMVCTPEGKKPIACLPNVQDITNAIFPGQSWTNEHFKFDCKQTEPDTLSFEVAACLLPDRTELAIGAEAGVETDGLYTCVKETNGQVTRKHKSGCYVDGRLHLLGVSWTSGNSQVHCERGANGYAATASGCITPNGRIVAVGAYTDVAPSSYFKCVLDAQVGSKANMVQVSEQEYRQWEASNGEGDEETAAGAFGSGSATQQQALALTAGGAGSALGQVGGGSDAITAAGSSGSGSTQGGGGGFATVGANGQQFGSGGFSGTNGAAGGSGGFSGANGAAGGNGGFGFTQAAGSNGGFATSGANGGCRDLHPMCKTLCADTCISNDKAAGGTSKRFLSMFPRFPKFYSSSSGGGSRPGFLGNLHIPSFWGGWGGRPSTYAYQQQAQRPQSSSGSFVTKRCTDLSDAVTELFNGLCRRSCGGCDSGSGDLLGIATRLVTAQCAFRDSKEAPVGLAL